jgi:hypothetical protein
VDRLAWADTFTLVKQKYFDNLYIYGENKDRGDPGAGFQPGKSAGKDGPSRRRSSAFKFFPRNAAGTAGQF